jgi:hypothetical protein
MLVGPGSHLQPRISKPPGQQAVSRLGKAAPDLGKPAPGGSASAQPPQRQLRLDRKSCYGHNLVTAMIDSSSHG